MFRRNFSNRSRFQGNRPQGYSPFNSYRSDGSTGNFDFHNDQTSYYGPMNGMGEQNNGYMSNDRESNFTNFANFATQNSRIHSNHDIPSPTSGIDLSSRWPIQNSMNQNFNGGHSQISDGSRIGLPNMQIFQSPSMSNNIPNINPAMSPMTNASYQSNFQRTGANSMISGISNDHGFHTSQTSQNTPFPSGFSQNLNQQKPFSGIINSCRLPPYEQVVSLKNRQNVNPFAISSVGRQFNGSENAAFGISGLPTETGSLAAQPGQFVLLNNPQFQSNSGPLSTTQQYKVQIWQKLRSEVDNDTCSLQRNWKLSNYELLPTDERK